MIGIIDYGLGNPESVKNMIRKVGGQAVVSRNETELLNCSKLVLPGVGSFKTGMSNLKNSGLDKFIHERVKSNIPLLGICLGAQLLTDFSEEGNCEGLSLIEGKTLKFRDLPSALTIPHMGWSTVVPATANHPLFGNAREHLRFYFVHSYYMECEIAENVLCNTTYGKPFASGIVKGHVAGVQFHPEKSHIFGMDLMRNFTAWMP